MIQAVRTPARRDLRSAATADPTHLVCLRLLRLFHYRVIGERAIRSTPEPQAFPVRRDANIRAGFEPCYHAHLRVGVGGSCYVPQGHLIVARRFIAGIVV